MFLKVVTRMNLLQVSVSHAQTRVVGRFCAKKPGSLFASRRRLVSIKPCVSQLFSERTTNMAKRNPGSTKACPANCIGGYADNQRSLYSGQKECMPTDILEMAKSGLQ